MYEWRKGNFGVQLTCTNWFLRRAKNFGGWWVLHNGARYSETGSYSDSVSFKSLTDAKKFVTKKVVEDNVC